MNDHHGALRQRWRIVSDLGQEKRVAQAVRDLAMTLDFSLERSEDMASAVAEACLNAMEHGNEGESAKHVTVDLLAADDLMRIRVFDEGTGFAREQVPYKRTDLMKDSPRGWGIPLICGLTDDWDVGRTSEGFYIELTFRQTGKRGELQ